MKFNNEQLSIILGSLNCYVRMQNLPNDLKNKTEEIRENIKKYYKKH